jgi:hypothetical protein
VETRQTLVPQPRSGCLIKIFIHTISQRIISPHPPFLPP